MTNGGIRMPSTSFAGSKQNFIWCRVGIKTIFEFSYLVMMRLLQRIVLLCLFFLLPFFAMAWGVLGHRIVGEIADSYLTAKAKAEIKKILGNESVAMSANWADFIKSDTSYRYLYNWHFINIEVGKTETELKAFFKKRHCNEYPHKNQFPGKRVKE